MKNNAKSRAFADSYSASEAAVLLGVSVPTLKAMVAEGTLESFRTPGGHLRITEESIDAVRREGHTTPRPARNASSVLLNRREHLEELTLAAQEHRAKQELEKLRAEEQQEAERRRAEEQTRQEQVAQRRAELKLERERLKEEKTQERLRQECERVLESRKRQAERELAAFRTRWHEEADKALSGYENRWLSAIERKEVLDGLEAEIQKRKPTDEPRMATILARALEALVQPLRIRRDAQESRQRLTTELLQSLPYEATEADKVRATAAIQEGLAPFDNFADVCKMRVAAEEALRPVRQGIEARLLHARILSWVMNRLPFLGRTEGDEARVKRECEEILAELPVDVTEGEAKEALEPTIQEACELIEQRQAEADRRARRATLIQQGADEVSSYLSELWRQGELSREDWLDTDFTGQVEVAVRRALEAALEGDEMTKEVRGLAREIVDEELG